MIRVIFQILIRFLSSHTSSVMFALTNPHLKSKMKKARIYWNRFQISSDRQIFRICSILRKKGLIYDLFIDKNHLTNIIKNEGDYPTAIPDIELFSTIFHSEPEVSAIVDQNRDQEDLELEPDTTITETVDEATDNTEASPSSDLVSVPSRNIIDAVD